MNEPTSKRSIELSVEVPGTPAEVWTAIATGTGISSWFVPAAVAEEEGGEVTMDFGAYGKETTRVTAWEPPHRFVYEGPESGERVLAYEWLVEARAGGTCIVRLVNSGFGTGSDWDDDYDGMASGWKLFLENLRLQLTHFRGQRTRGMQPMATVPGPNDPAWTALCAALGVPTTAEAGDRLEISGDGAPALAGTVERALPSAYVLLVHEPLPGTGFIAAEGYGGQVVLSVYLYLYGDPGVVAATEETWQGWMADRSPAPVTSPT
jgi:uncharacterized protein YndB with AHSA1/START domain